MAGATFFRLEARDLARVVRAFDAVLLFGDDALLRDAAGLRDDAALRDDAGLRADGFLRDVAVLREVAVLRGAAALRDDAALRDVAALRGAAVFRDAGFLRDDAFLRDVAVFGRAAERRFRLGLKAFFAEAPVPCPSAETLPMRASRSRSLFSSPTARAAPALSFRMSLAMRLRSLVFCLFSLPSALSTRLTFVPDVFAILHLQICCPLD